MNSSESTQINTILTTKKNINLFITVKGHMEM